MVIHAAEASDTYNAAKIIAASIGICRASVYKRQIIMVEFPSKH